MPVLPILNRANRTGRADQVHNLIEISAPLYRSLILIHSLSLAFLSHPSLSPPPPPPSGPRRFSVADRQCKAAKVSHGGSGIGGLSDGRGGIGGVSLRLRGAVSKRGTRWRCALPSPRSDGEGGLHGDNGRGGGLSAQGW